MRKDASKLSFQSKEFFIGNKNEIWYYHDWNTGCSYARARFEWSDVLKTWFHDEWWQLSKADIKDEDAQVRTTKAINRHFGYFAIERSPFAL